MRDGRGSRVDDHAGLLAACPDDAFVRWNVRPGERVAGLAGDGAAAWVVIREHYEHRPWLNAVGPAEPAAGLVAALLASGPDPVPAGLTVPVGALEHLPAPVRPHRAGAWTWWWTADAPAPRPHEHLVARLPAGDPEVRRELLGLLAVASPTASAEATDPTVRAWWGLREPGGSLVACAADRPYVPGVPHLGSIATRPDRRGRGYGSSLVAAVVRDCLREGAPAVTLGMHADNEAGRALYTSLGMTESHRFVSGGLPG